MAKSYLEPLLAFSGNAFADARLKLVQSLSDHELRTLLQDGLKRCTARKTLEQLSNRMLDHIDAEQRATSELPAPNNNLQHPMQPQHTPARDAHNPAILGTSSQRVQPKRKAAENADPFGVRLHKAAALSAANDGIKGEDDDDDEDWEGTTAKHGHDRQDETPADASADINVIDIRPTTFTAPKLRIGAWVIDIFGKEEWRPLGDLALGGSIHARFLTDFAFNRPKRAAYGAMARNAARYKTEGKCVNIAIWQRGCAHSAFEKAHGNEHRACDTCIRTKRLCVRIVADGSGTKLCVFPLPEVLREGKTLNSIAVWVMGG